MLAIFGTMIDLRNFWWITGMIHVRHFRFLHFQFPEAMMITRHQPCWQQILDRTDIHLPYSSLIPLAYSSLLYWLVLRCVFRLLLSTLYWLFCAFVSFDLCHDDVNLCDIQDCRGGVTAYVAVLAWETRQATCIWTIRKARTWRYGVEGVGYSCVNLMGCVRFWPMGWALCISCISIIFLWCGFFAPFLS